MNLVNKCDGTRGLTLPGAQQLQVVVHEKPSRGKPCMAGVALGCSVQNNKIGPVMALFVALSLYALQRAQSGLADVRAQVPRAGRPQCRSPSLLVT